MEPDDIPSELEHVLLTEAQIHERLSEIAAEIDRDYAGKDLLLVGVLKGAVMVMADVVRQGRGVGGRFRCRHAAVLLPSAGQGETPDKDPHVGEWLHGFIK